MQNEQNNLAINNKTIPGKDVFATKGIEGNTGYVEKLKEKAADLYDLLTEFSPTTPEALRCFAVAKTNLEESVMWAIKGVSRSTTSNS